MRITTKDFFTLDAEELGKHHELKGWVHRVRFFGGVSFILLRDRGGFVQLVLEGDTANTRDRALTVESIIAVIGRGVVNAKAPGGRELRIESMTLISAAEADPPFPINDEVLRSGLDAILENRPLSLRHRKIRSIFTVQSSIIGAFAEYLRDRDFTEIKTSKLIGGMTEGGTGLFEVSYFDTKVYLAQSPQFYKQTLVAAGLERVFEVAPAYRAEKHDTPRHLNEYVSLDLELAFIENELDLIDLERGLLSHIFKRVAEKNAEELALWNTSVPDSLAVAAAPLLSYDQALKIAAREDTEGHRRFHDLNPEAEKLLCAWADREYACPLVFVNEFPKRERPFYTHPMDSGKTRSFDALFRGLEITTGGQRINDYRQMLDSLAAHGMPASDMKDYLAIFKYGCPPHGGFAIGLERLTQKILGLANVKEASLFPRDRKRIRP